MNEHRFLSDADLESMLERRAGPGIPADLAGAINSAIVGQAERSAWWRVAAPPAGVTRALRTAWVVAIVGLLLVALVSSLLAGAELLRRANELTVLPSPTVMPAPSAAPTASPTPVTAPAVVAARPIDQVNDVAFAGDGSLWLATGGGLIHWNVSAGWSTLYGQNDGLPTTAVMSVAVAPDGTVWAAGSSARGWLAQFDGRWTTFTTPADLDGLEIVDFGGMAIGNDGRVWAVFGGDVREPKLLRFDGSWKALDVPEWIGGNVVPWGSSLTVAPDGTLWAAAPRSGIAAYDGTTWTTHSKESAGLPRAPWLAGVGLDGSVWAELSAEGCTTWSGCATPAGGVARFDGGGWTVYTTADGLADDDAHLLVGPGGDVWVTYAAKPGTVSRFDGRRWFTTQVPDLSMGTALAVAPDGALWLRSRDGFLRFDGSSVTQPRLPTIEVPTELPPLELSLTSGPSTTASIFGDITWRTYASPSEYSLRAVGTPHGAVAIDGPDLRWLTASGAWAGTTLPIAPWRATAAGDAVFVHDRTAARVTWDGLRWIAGDLLDLPGSLGFIFRVASGQHGTVIAGATKVAWSTDGQHFHEAAAGPAGPPPETSGVNAMDNVSIGPVFATPDGFVALVPRDRASWGGPFPAPQPWFSPDGSTWNPVGSESPFGDGSVSDVAARDGRYVAVGTEGAIWVSDDGLRWRALPALASPEPCDPYTCSGELVDVEAADFGWMALSRDGLAWVSSDGEAWGLLRDWPRVRGGWTPPTLAIGAGTIVATGIAVDRDPGARGASTVIVVGTIEP